MQTINAFHDLVASAALGWVSMHTGIGPAAGEWYIAASKLTDGFATASLACVGLIFAGIWQVRATR